ncbi:MAG: ABC transporter ATP-binding protein [Bacteroidales bacterium]|nr:ABC transporter ATP-binding protein [Bacteroidales bacterium]MDD3167304.1 ABC transporter ATP-binding protein [Bacteroidales bacterium]MDD4771731.1 ABC transporter ATP-binding protein [Bacteroidales bacterium]HKL93610.1 ABC transporter ATP-binding protein [Bacteroidales bacterium]
MIQVNNVRFSYGKETVLNDISFSVEKGSVYGFIGANGAGKTTMIRLLLGLIRQTQGSIRIQGATVCRSNFNYLRQVGSMIENPSIYAALTAYENMSVYAPFYGLSRKELLSCLKKVGLDRYPDVPAGSYSLGMKQRLAFGMSLMHNPDLLILDEPMNGLDPQGIAEMRSILSELQEEGKTLFFSSHILSEMDSMCDAICVINKGQCLFQGTIDELKASNPSQRYRIKCSDPDRSVALLSTVSTEPIERKKEDVLVCLDSKERVPAMLTLLQENGVRVFEVFSTGDRLEDAYFNLLKKRI